LKIENGNMTRMPFRGSDKNACVQKRKLPLLVIGDGG